MENINDILNFELKNEWIVEQIQGRDNKVTKVIGKVIFKQQAIKDELTEDELENIWDMCNYGPAGHNLMEIYSGLYSGHNFIDIGNAIYIPLSEVNCVNCDIFIRKHYEPLEGYWIKYSLNHDIKDVWIKSDKKKFLENYNFPIS